LFPLQADVLAQYKPTIDTKSLIAELKRSDKLAADGLASFKKIRNIVLYYEDVVSNHTVSLVHYILVWELNQPLFL
jgi:hypothetical protein